MLYRVMISPSIFSDLPEDEYARKLFCCTVYNILLDFLDNCTILFPSHESAIEEIFNLTENWPEKTKQKIMRLIRELERQNRFSPRIPKDISNSVISKSKPLNDSHGLCKYLPGLSLKYPLTPTVTGKNCCLLPCTELENLTSIIDVADYFDSQFSQSRRNGMSLSIINDGDWNQEDFTQRVLVPIFQDSKHVQLCDRWIGRSILNSKKREIRESYKESIEWLIRVFAKETNDRKDRSFEIYTGLVVKGLSENKIQEIREILKDIEYSISKQYSFPINLIAKREKEKPKKTEFQNELPHARYLITDQVGVLVERGFDLLYSSEMMKDMGLDSISESPRIRDVTVVVNRNFSAVLPVLQKLNDL